MQDANHVLKLIKTYRRNLDHYTQQAAQLGDLVPVHVQNAIEANQESIIGLESELRQIEQKLKEHQAIYGINTDPSVLIQLDSIKEYFDRQIVVPRTAPKTKNLIQVSPEVPADIARQIIRFANRLLEEHFKKQD